MVLVVRACVLCGSPDGGRPSLIRYYVIVPLHAMSLLDACLDLLRRLPPSKTSHNLALLQSLLPEDVTVELLQSIDQPLATQTCAKTGREYLLCDYNRDGDSYRSPWSGEWEPPIDDPVLMDDAIRQLEIKANEAFDSYRELYYEGGVSSVYMWDLDDGIAGVVLFKKTTPGAGWDSVHVFEALDHTRNAAYKLTSTVMLHMTTANQSLGSMNLSGNLTRQVEQELPLESPASHIPNLGRMIEDQEIKIRNSLQEVYFGKCKDIVNDLRSLEKLSLIRGDRQAHGLVVESLSGAHSSKK